MRYIHACFFLFAIVFPSLKGIGQQLPLLPYPAAVTLMDESFSLTPEVIIVSAPECQREATYFRDYIKEVSGVQLSFKLLDSTPLGSGTILFMSGNAVDFEDILRGYEEFPVSYAPIQSVRDNSEEYRLMVLPNMILVTANQPAGIFYSIQTLRQLLAPSLQQGKLNLPCEVTGVGIEDRPQFRHRGLLLDCCRHFMTVDFIKKYLDLLAYYKMNVFHWHLTEDQAWRIEIKTYPGLTTTGATRTEPDGSLYQGYYTQEQIKEIVAYATALHITVIPEIELPGHCLAALASYPWLGCTGEKLQVTSEWGVFKDIYCAGNDSTMEFLFNVLDEVCLLFPSPYIHIGGDEAPKFRWEHCPKCQQRMKDEKLKTEDELQTWFINTIAAHLARNGRRIIGWDEILDGGIPDRAIVQSWRSMQGGQQAADAGHFAVMSPTSHCYLDYGLESIDLAKVYSFDPAPESMDGERGFIIGGECNMWTEHAPQELVDQKVFPRILALAEVLWTYKSNFDFEAFRERVEMQYPVLEEMGVDYGFESVPARIQVRAAKGSPMTVSVEKTHEGDDLDILYQWIRKDLADTAWKTYSGPIPVVDSGTLRARIIRNGRTYNEIIERRCQAHLAAGCPVEINYTPNPNYTGGGPGALTDGSLGSDHFRDGVWQAVQGISMEAIVDLGKITGINELSTHWFHYSNAWIFRPDEVAYFVSDDGKKWRKAGRVEFGELVQEPGEMIKSASIQNLQLSGRYVKMKATNAGPCPSWHDAAGEPSWLFCDELVVN